MLATFCRLTFQNQGINCNLRLRKDFFESKRRSCWLINAKMTGLLLKSAGGKLILTGNIFHVKRGRVCFSEVPCSPPHSPQPRSPCGWCLHSSYTSLCLFIFQDILQEHACHRLKSMVKCEKFWYEKPTRILTNILHTSLSTHYFF